MALILHSQLSGKIEWIEQDNVSIQLSAVSYQLVSPLNFWDFNGFSYH